MDFCRSGRIRRIYWIPLFVSACHAVPAFFLYRLSMQSLAEPGTEENPYQKGNSAAGLLALAAVILVVLCRLSAAWGR